MIDGPLSVPDRSQPTVVTYNGHETTTYPLLPGVHYICSPGVFGANQAALAPYKDAQQVNLESVYAGDNPANPLYTVALTFPDEATAAAVIAGLSF